MNLWLTIASAVVVGFGFLYWTALPKEVATLIPAPGHTRSACLSFSSNCELPTNWRYFRSSFGADAFAAWLSESFAIAASKSSGKLMR
jgi:hypothetical protein